MGMLSAETQNAVTAASAGDRDTFAAAVLVLADAGWDDVQLDIADEFLRLVEERIGSAPTINDIVVLAQAAHLRTRDFLNASVYDIEVLIRGFFGASQMLTDMPRNVVLIMQLALIGVLESMETLDFREPARDTI